MDPQLLRGMKVTVIGAARSGLGAAGLLRQSGAVVFLSDHQKAEALGDQRLEVEALGIPYELGVHSDRAFDCGLMVVSPGVPDKAEVIQEARRRGLMIVSELEFSSWFCTAPMVAVTGSNGKTTTTTLLGRMLSDARRGNIVAGNIGTAFSSVVTQLSGDDVAVLEVSSFQLDHIETFHPAISMLLNITADHLDRYDGSMDRYAASKAQVTKNQTESDVLIYNDDDPRVREIAGRARCHTVGFSLKTVLAEGAFVESGKMTTVLGNRKKTIIATDEITIKGNHNVYNAMAATLAAQLLGVGPASIRATLRNFRGVEHRLEFVRELRGVRYVNDSKATNVDSVWYALQAFPEPVVLLLGGRDKGNDYNKIADQVKAKVRVVVAIGESAGTVQKFFSPLTEVKVAGSMPEAVQIAHREAQRGEIVLLSPACASFDWFRNYEHRGEVFKELVNALE